MSPFTNIPATKAIEMMNTEDGSLLDVRTPEEFMAGSLPRAVNINIYAADFMNQLDKLEKEKSYMVFCQSGGRSLIAMTIMKNMGFQKIANLEGGINSLYAKQSLTE